MAEAPTARDKLEAAAADLFRRRGYCATSVEELCAAAGVTKGAFFHHFPSKEALAVSAARRWSAAAEALFAAARREAPEAPWPRLRAYLALRKALLVGETAAFTCLLGTLAQETYATSPAIRGACASGIFGHADRLEADIAAAIAARGDGDALDAASLAAHTQAVIQGAFVLAKAAGEARAAGVVAAQIDHLERYLAMLLAPAEAEGE